MHYVVITFQQNQASNYIDPGSHNKGGSGRSRPKIVLTQSLHLGRHDAILCGRARVLL